VSPWAPWIIIPVPGEAGIGCWLGLVADGLYLLAWLLGDGSSLTSRTKALAA